MKDHNPERVWLLLLGASLAGGKTRDEVFRAVAAEDFPVELRSLAASLKDCDGKDLSGVKASLEEMGVRVNGKLLESVIERGQTLVRRKRYATVFARLAAAANAGTAADLDEIAADTLKDLERLIAGKGRTT